MWVHNYPTRTLLPNSGPCAEDFYTILQPQGTSYDGFKHGDNALLTRAYDTDIQQKKSRFPGGVEIVDTPGEDIANAETVDMLYFCGHGDPSQIYFAEKKSGVADSDDTAPYDEINLGDGPLKWLVLDACQVLENTLISGNWSIFNRWTKAFNPGGGLRYILGFHTTCKNDNFRGKMFAQFLNPIQGNMDGEYIRIAWQYACEETEPNTSEWAILRVGDQNSGIANDRWTSGVLQHDVPLVPGSGKQKFTYQKRIGPVATTPEIIG